RLRGILKKRARKSSAKTASPPENSRRFSSKTRTAWNWRLERRDSCSESGCGFPRSVAYFNDSATPVPREGEGNGQIHYPIPWAPAGMGCGGEGLFQTGRSRLRISCKAYYYLVGACSIG